MTLAIKLVLNLPTNLSYE